MSQPIPFTRYAVYWAPDAADPLAVFGAAWLGHEPARAGAAPAPRLRLGLPEAEADRITADPRHYGLHATLKAPFRLKPGVTPAGLSKAIAALAQETPAFSTAPLRLTHLSDFLALCPSRPSAKLAALADRCVVELDPLRAPLTEAEIARRKPQFLTDHQRDLLAAWGYPHVLDQFRFHITLTGRLTADERALVMMVLKAATAAFCAGPFEVGAIALFGDPGGGQPFQLVQRFALGPATPAAM